MSRMLKALGAGAALYSTARVIRRIRQPSFEGCTVIITGGSRGLGLTLARLFADEGARIVLAARNQEDLAEAARELEGRGVDVLTVAGDLGVKAQAQSLVERTVARFGGIDILVNNAGTMQVGPIEHMSDDDFREAMDIHFWAVHHLSRAALPYLKQSEIPRIVNVASIGGEVAVPHMAPYAASKFALVGYSDALRAELITDGVKVTTVSPGLMRTGSHVNALFKGDREHEYAWFASMAGIPLFSTTAESAARKILRACRRGQPHLIITLPARVAIALDGVAPNLSLYARDLVGRILPPPASARGDVPQKGRDVDEKAPDVLTHLADREAKRHGEE